MLCQTNFDYKVLTEIEMLRRDSQVSHDSILSWVGDVSLHYEGNSHKMLL